MSRAPRAKRNAAPKGQVTEGNGKSVGWFVASWKFLGPALGLVGGLLLQDYFDVLKTSRELAKEYATSANVSASEVENSIVALMKVLGDPQSSIPDKIKVELRNSLLALQSDTERLRIQTGVPETLFQPYAKAMADLADSVDAATGAADAKPVIQALDRFLVSKRAFEESVAQSYRPVLGLS